MVNNCLNIKQQWQLTLEFNAVNKYSIMVGQILSKQSLETQTTQLDPQKFLPCFYAHLAGLL